MLDSGGMFESEDTPPTLATLRRGKARSQKRLSSLSTDIEPSSQATLFSSVPEEALVPKVQMASSVLNERTIWSVGELVIKVRQHLETTYFDLWVEGEISNCRPAPSGHIYFTLKDGEAQLPVVLFRRQAILLRFRPTDGLAVLVRGRISIYESRGQLQLIAETMEPRGAGGLQLAFEQLKARLLAEGLFDADRKRPLPAFPQCVGIITSLTGAVVRDIVNVMQRRHRKARLLVYPATMQGLSSPASVIEGIRWFNVNISLVDVILVARGGGSPEDLAAFNDEMLARTIAASDLPVVSAIGHETDFTIADFVADLRAATPSAAAELVTAAQHRIEERVAILGMRVQRAGRFHVMHARQHYARLSAESVLTRLYDAVNRRDQRLDELRMRLEVCTQRRLRIYALRLELVTGRLREQNITRRVIVAHRWLQSKDRRLYRIGMQISEARQRRLSRADARLETLSPLAVLSRGYALIYSTDGVLLRSTTETAPGKIIRARMGHGVLEAEVTQIK
jgi:exodeoxyribonuclease VII large subunit